MANRRHTTEIIQPMYVMTCRAIWWGGGRYVARTSISTAKLVKWSHWQVVCVWFVISTRQPSSDHALQTHNPHHDLTACTFNVPNTQSESATKLQMWMCMYITNSLIHLFTHSIEHSPSWEGTHTSFSQEIPHISRNLKVHYRAHSSRHVLPVAIRIHSMPSQPISFKVHCNIKLRPIVSLPSGFLPSKFSASAVCTSFSSPHTCHSPCPNHPTWFAQSNIWCTVHITSPCYVIFSLCCHLLSLRNKSPPQHPTY